jgi:transposase
MPRTRPPYSREFHHQVVDLVRAGRDPADLEREFEPTTQSISHWWRKPAGKKAAGKRRK